MTKKELFEALAEFPDDAGVYVSDGYAHVPVQGMCPGPATVANPKAPRGRSLFGPDRPGDEPSFIDVPGAIILEAWNEEPQDAPQA